MSDKCYFEMNETEANLKNMMNTLEFLDYQIATGNIFTVGETVEQENIDKINDLTSEISDSLCKALDGVTEIQKIIDGSATELPEEIKAEQEKGHIFMHEVDCADAISHLQGQQLPAWKISSLTEKMQQKLFLRPMMERMLN